MYACKSGDRLGQQLGSWSQLVSSVQVCMTKVITVSRKKLFSLKNRIRQHNLGSRTAATQRKYCLFNWIIELWIPFCPASS